jgi:hypothetical protein
MKYAHLKIAEAQAHIVALDRDVAVLARALESCDQADHRKLITEAMETITTERRRAYSDLACRLASGRSSNHHPTEGLSPDSCRSFDSCRRGPTRWTCDERSAVQPTETIVIVPVVPIDVLYGAVKPAVGGSGMFALHGNGEALVA